ncbi:hypothetical protein E4U59_005752 [Claviceps monticola]|nr:hypothetical protein E4U59_005752 [Claviceps monticola]
MSANRLASPLNEPSPDTLSLASCCKAFRACKAEIVMFCPVEGEYGVGILVSYRVWIAEEGEDIGYNLTVPTSRKRREKSAAGIS